MTDYEKIGRAAMEAVIEGGMITADVDENGVYTGVLKWNGNAPEQLGEALKRCSANSTIDLINDRDDLRARVAELEAENAALREERDRLDYTCRTLTKRNEDLCWTPEGRPGWDSTMLKIASKLLSGEKATMEDGHTLASAARGAREEWDTARSELSRLRDRIAVAEAALEKVEEWDAPYALYVPDESNRGLTIGVRFAVRDTLTQIRTRITPDAEEK